MAAAAEAFPAKSSFPPPSRTGAAALSPEARYWRSFKPDEIGGLASAVAGLAFSPAAPHDLAAAASASVSLYDGRSLCQPPRTAAAALPDLAYSPSYRSDGRLLAAGCHSGLVQVFELRSRAALRRLRAHARPARVARFPHLDKLHLFSAADDALLLYWDVAAGDGGGPLLSVAAHKDYVRAGAPSPASPDVFATGSYDHTVAIWDVRDRAAAASSSPSLRLRHDRPVESVVFLPAGGLLASAGGNTVKIWDVVGGGRLLHTMEGHYKTVTSMCVGKIPGVAGDADKHRLLSVSLDGYMKVFDFLEFKVTHSMRYPSPLLSVAHSPSCSARAIGTSNGTIYIGRRKESKEVGVDDEVVVTAAKRKVLRPSNLRYFYRGQTEQPSEKDTVVSKAKKVKMAEHDKLLRRFRHKEALVSALNTRNPQSIVGVMEELVARKKLIRCVHNLEHDELGLLLGFLHKYTTTPRYASFLMGLAMKVLQIRGKDIRESAELQRPVMNLRREVLEEVKLQTWLQEVQGIISPLMTRTVGR